MSAHGVHLESPDWGYKHSALIMWVIGILDYRHRRINGNKASITGKVYVQFSSYFEMMLMNMLSIEHKWNEVSIYTNLLTRTLQLWLITTREPDMIYFSFQLRGEENSLLRLVENNNTSQIMGKPRNEYLNEPTSSKNWRKRVYCDPTWKTAAIAIDPLHLNAHLSDYTSNSNTIHISF